MKNLADIHSHMLWGLDDGAQTREEMIAMMTQAYEDGIRTICFTPHFEPDSFAYSSDTVALRFTEAKKYAAEHFEELSLFLGSEISYRNDAVDFLRDGRCPTIAGGRYVLLDFFGASNFKQMVSAIDQLWCGGYIPVVAHVERYDFVYKKFAELASLSRDGVLFQVTSRSLIYAEKTSRERKMAEKLLAHGVVDIIASDSHDPKMRKPSLSVCYDYVATKYGAEYAQALFYTNPMAVIENDSIQV